MNRAMPTFIFLSAIAHAVVYIAWADTFNRAQVGKQLSISILHSNSRATATRTQSDFLVLSLAEPNTDQKNINTAAPQIVRTGNASRNPESSTSHKEAAKNRAQKPAVQAKSSGKKIRQLINKKLAQHFYYPLLAYRNGWQGRVILSMRVGVNGELSNFRLAKSSGYESLDRAAINSASKIKKVPEIVSMLTTQSMEIKVPVVYRLTDG